MLSVGNSKILSERHILHPSLAKFLAQILVQYHGVDAELLLCLHPPSFNPCSSSIPPPLPLLLLLRLLLTLVAIFDDTSVKRVEAFRLWLGVAATHMCEFTRNKKSLKSLS